MVEIYSLLSLSIILIEEIFVKYVKRHKIWKQMF